MSTLERSYRRALRSYPRAWRATNEDVVIGTLLDEADATGRRHPRLPELVSLLVHGISARVGAVAADSGGTRDRVASLALGTGVAITFVMFFGTEWTPWSQPTADSDAQSFGPFASAAVVISGLWFVALVCALVGWRRLSIAVLVLTVPSSVVAVLLTDALPMLWSRPPATALVFLAVLSILVCCGRPSRLPVVTAAAASVGLFLLIGASTYSLHGESYSGRLDLGWLIISSGWWPIAIFFAAGGAAVTARRFWVMPLLALAFVWTTYSAGTGWMQNPDPLVAVLSITGAVVGFGAVLAAYLFGRGYRLVAATPQ